MEFPRLVYASAKDFVSVVDESDYQSALEAGWFATVPEAIDALKIPSAKIDSVPPTRTKSKAQ